MNVGELFVELGFDVDEQKLKDFDAGIKSLENHMLSLTAVATGSVVGLDVFLSRVADRATAMRQFGEQTGYSTQALQEWALVINRTNPLISIEGAQEKYKAFAEYVKNINWGAGGGAILSQLGVNYIPGADPAQYLQQLSEKLPAFIAHFGRARAGMLLDQIGLGAGAIDALMTTAAQRHQMTDGLIISDSELNNIDRLNEKIAQLTQRWERFETDLLNRWADPLMEGMDAIESGMEKWLPEINKVANAVGGWKLIGEAVAAFFATRWAIAMAAALAATAPLTLEVLALVAAIRDLYRAVHGLPSISGDIAKNFMPGLKMWLTHPGKAFDNLGAAIDVPMHRWGVDRFLMGDGGDKTVNNSLTQNIHSTADPGTVGREAARLWDDFFQKQLNVTGAGINLGVPY